MLRFLLGWAEDLLGTVVGLVLLIFGSVWLVAAGMFGLFIPLFAWVFRGDVRVAWEVYGDLACGPILWIGEKFYEQKSG